jgi:hypothetical protein
MISVKHQWHDVLSNHELVLMVASKRATSNASRGRLMSLLNFFSADSIGEAASAESFDDVSQTVAQFGKLIIRQLVTVSERLCYAVSG